ncbi:MAG: hypothetical protein EPO08_07925 [Rhodospirillaceae bacterium]|nr:MAG: hypothetical protein EPO08_07925 [Rhodospirillaceae bacterium]
MITLEQLAAALYGVWLLLKLDVRALDYFEKTPGGFARSFLPAAVLLPLDVVHSILVYDPTQTKLALGPYLVVQVLAYVISCVAFPFVMLYVTQLLNRAPRFLTYMVPYNWFQLPVNIVLLSMDLLVDVGWISSQLFGFIYLFTLTVYFAFGTFVARIGLVIGIMSAMGIVILDFLLGLITNQLITRI